MRSNTLTSWARLTRATFTRVVPFPLQSPGGRIAERASQVAIAARFRAASAEDPADRTGVSARLQPTRRRLLASTLPPKKAEDVMWSALFPHNENAIDRALRVFVGGVLVSLAATGVTAWGWLGVLPLVTGLVGSCPAYRVFGIDTCKTRPV